MCHEAIIIRSCRRRPGYVVEYRLSGARDVAEHLGSILPEDVDGDADLVSEYLAENVCLCVVDEAAVAVRNGWLTAPGDLGDTVIARDPSTLSTYADEQARSEARSLRAETALLRLPRTRRARPITGQGALPDV